MSLINRNNLSYIYSVEQYFLSLTRRGVALSALDYQMIKSWEKKGVPLSIVCAGIKKGIDSFKNTHKVYSFLPRSIKYFECLIEKEFTNYKSLKVGAHLKQGKDVEEKEAIRLRLDVLIDKTENLIIKEKDNNIKLLYSLIYNKILSVKSHIDKNYLHIYAELETIDRFFLDEFCKLILSDELTGIMKEAEQRLSQHKFKMSKEAYERTLESLRNLVVRKRYGLLSIQIGEEP